MPVDPGHRFPGGALGAFVLLQGGWFGCVLGPPNDMPWLPIVIAALAAALTVLSAPSRLLRTRDVVVFVALGVAIDSLQTQFGILSFPGSSAPLPYWMVCLWVLFGALFRHCFAWMRGRVPLALLLGAIAGPPCYLAGRAFEVLEMPAGTELAFVSLGLEWALVMGGAVAVETRRMRLPASSSATAE